MRLPSLAPLGHFLAARKAKIAPKIKDLKERAGRVRFNVDERKLKTMS
jgi:hypothetical protein